MIQLYVNKLFESLPKNIKHTKTPIEIDLVLEGGAFNGSYLVGALFFLKKMEKHKIIVIKRISGSSIGAFTGLLYFMDSLDLVYDLYAITLNDFKKNYFINIHKIIHNYLKEKIPHDICCNVSNKLYITYTNVKKRRKITVSKYKNVDHLLDSIIKSCFMPLFIDKQLFYKKKYIDGFLPYVFPLQDKRKRLYLDITSNDKICNSISVKNEKTNFHRIMNGLFDIHSFFVNESNTNLCSYVNDWNIKKQLYNWFKKIIEFMVLNVFYTIYLLKKCITPQMNKHFICKTIKKCFNILYFSFIKNYCI